MIDIERAVAAVKQLQEDLKTGEAAWLDALHLLTPFICKESLDPMVAAMSEEMRECFFMDGRLQFTAFDDLVAERLANGDDPSCWIALREWLYEQPFDVDPSRPLPTAEQARNLWLVETFQRILAHVKTRPLESILDQLPPRWRRETLRELLRGMRPGLPTILATCRAHGQDEEPWHILMAWEASLPEPLPRKTPPL